jgi:putative sigma-54 modulation protein
MDIIFRGQHVTVPEDFRSYANDHLSKITRYLPSADHAIVDLRREAKGEDGRYVVQVTVSANGRYLRAEERHFDLTVAIDACADVLSRQVVRLKERKLLRSERRVNKDELVASGEEVEEEPNLPPDAELIEGRVVRMKQFSMKPMTEAEAIEQMEMLGHNFFLFQDTDRDTLALLYRRRDGDYGMILPETA